MHRDLFFAQTAKEASVIISKEPDAVCIPVNLETYFYCLEKKIKFINLNEFVNSEFHKKALIASNKFTEQLNFKKINYSLKNEIKCKMRNRFHSIFFIDELIKRIKKNRKINKIFVSGWSKENHLSDMEYILTDIISNLKIKTKIVKIDKKKEKNDFDVFEYTSTDIIKNNKYKIYLANLGYNFSRFVFTPKFRKYIFAVPLFHKISILKKTIFNLFGVKFIKFTKNRKKQIKSFNDYFDCNKNTAYFEVINIFKKKYQKTFEELNQKIKALEINNKINRYNLILSNNVRNFDGALLDAENIINHQKSICISHGTVTNGFNKYDRIYKKFISDSVYFEKSSYNCSQSKIFTNFIKNRKKNKNILFTGNLIFANSFKQNLFKKNNILVAVTLKGFENLQYYGVEMYFEFLNNLSFFDKLAKSDDLKIIINVHPQEISLIKKIKKLFPNLIITFQKIEKLLHKSFTTISFSSTAIEDSLYSKVPVILFDPAKRYMHCKAEKNYKKIGSSIYYISKKENLLSCINNIKSARKFDFNKYTYSYNVKENIKNHILGLLN